MYKIDVDEFESNFRWRVDSGYMSKFELASESRRLPSTLPVGLVDASRLSYEAGKHLRGSKNNKYCTLLGWMVFGNERAERDKNTPSSTRNFLPVVDEQQLCAVMT